MRNLKTQKWKKVCEKTITRLANKEMMKSSVQVS